MGFLKNNKVNELEELKKEIEKLKSEKQASEKKTIKLKEKQPEELIIDEDAELEIDEEDDLNDDIVEVKKNTKSKEQEPTNDEKILEHFKYAVSLCVEEMLQNDTEGND